MVILNSLKLLEQISEIEERISKVEEYMQQLGINKNNDKLLALIIEAAIRKGNRHQVQ